MFDQLKCENIDPPTVKALQRKLESQIKEWEKTYKKGTVCANMRLEQSKAKLDKKKEQEGSASASRRVRVAPAAIALEAEAEPSSSRLGNTGGTQYTGEITHRQATYKAAEETLKQRKKDTITKIDWISYSFPTVTDVDEQRLLWAGISDLMEQSSIAIAPRGKGHHGYTDSAALTIANGASNARHVGMVAWSEKQGYFLELSGLGCDCVMKHIEDLFILIRVYSGRLSRLDIALDLHSDYCIKHGLTVPKFSRQASEGFFQSAFTPSHVKQNISRPGDWGCIIDGFTTAVDYDPLEHAPKGLTVTVGTNKSDNQIVFYEKGKQMLGAMPDRVADEFADLLADPERTEEGQERFTHLCEKYEVDAERCHERAWVRVERRFRRGANKKFIAPEMLLDPDSAFCDSMSGLTEVFQGYSQHIREKYTDVKSFRRVSAEKLEVMNLSKKLYYARQNVGALVHTLGDLGYSAEQIVEKLSSKQPLKDIVFDLLE